MRLLLILNILSVYCEFNVGLSIPPIPWSVLYGEPLYLTPLIEENNITEAKELAQVNLKQSHAALTDVESYSGLFVVNKEYNSSLFHWYFVAEEEPETAPLLLWLNGGPGTSSMLGLFQAHGPFQITEDLELEPREYHWTKNHHVVYIDSPVGTGFSHTGSEEGYSKNTDDVSINLHEALEQFFKLWPNLKNNDFYLTGESYSGKYLPNLAHLILEKGIFENFKGVAIGNGFIDADVQLKGFGDYLYQQGFVDEATKEEFTKKEQKCSEIVEAVENNSVPMDDPEFIQPCRDLLDPFSNKTLFANATGYGYVYNVLTSNPPTVQRYRLDQYLKKSSVHRHMHIGRLERLQQQEYVQKQLGASIVLSEKNHVEELLAKNYKVLIYNGQLDVLFPYVITVNLIKTLDFEHMDEYNKAERFIWKVDDEVAGYIKSAGSLTEVMVIGAGHMVPQDQPKRAWDLITKFTRNELPK
ncbi:venom serine carboxypeptidase-like [Chrysoperla carnea]|uniref:venom serine carboxypeptidase-like n=1 Tax=Chrysoperla carnea TaxID=189513 RepID=UPI001D087CAF|nr:venom serine carboxypeptidase-like [Chrysoperla carnea]